MGEHARVLAEAFAVVRHDDHPGTFQVVTAIELVEQPAELLIEICDAVVVQVVNEPQLLGRDSLLVERPPVFDQSSLLAVPGPDPEAVHSLPWKLIGPMGVEVIQKGKKRAIRGAPRQPVEELVIDRLRLFSIADQEPREVFSTELRWGEVQLILQETVQPS